MRVNLGDIAEERKESCKTNGSSVPTVGLEHLIPGQIRLTEWDELGDNTFTKVFHKGDVLFGRRRAYLKKAAVAQIEGVCSGDITVITANPDKLYPKLLPFIIQNDSFFDYAVGNSAGSLSPRAKWANIKNFEINLPSLEQQEQLANVLWTIEDTIQSYRLLLEKSDELVKARFVEMFEQGNDWDCCELSQCCINPDNIKCGPFGSQLHAEDYISNGIPVYGIPEVNSGFKTSPRLFISESKAESLSAYSLQAGDIAVSRKGNVGQAAFFNADQQAGIIHSDVLRIRVDVKKIDPVYLIGALHNSPRVKHQITMVSSGAVMPGTNVTKLKKIVVNVPPIELQRKYGSFVYQVDKSKVALQKTIEEAQKLLNSMVQENLG